VLLIVTHSRSLTPPSVIDTIFSFEVLRWHIEPRELQRSLTRKIVCLISLTVFYGVKIPGTGIYGVC